ERAPVSLDELSGPAQAALSPCATAGEEDAREEREKLLECFERCLQSLDHDRRALILEYYHGKQRDKIENRRALAARFGLTINALSIRACRIRDRLESCVGECRNR
ncbi:MAG: hypothetical protein ACRD68_13415, partial [Pyrinomonadaceae bacterium]